MEEPSRHGTIQLGWGPVGIFWDIVDAIDESAAFASVPRRIRSDISGAVFHVSIMSRLATKVAEVQLFRHDSTIWR
jgi:hypothetical protein